LGRSKGRRSGAGNLLLRWGAGSVQGADGLSGRRRESGRVSGAVSEP
jgi:hypothetical protein